MMKSSRSPYPSAESHVPAPAQPAGRHGVRAGYAAATALISGAVVLLLTIGVGASARGLGQDDHPKLPQGKGREVMIRVCSACHEPEMAADQQFDKAGWKALVDQMASKGADATDAEFGQIVDYLSAAFPAK